MVNLMKTRYFMLALSVVSICVVGIVINSFTTNDVKTAETKTPTVKNNENIHQSDKNSAFSIEDATDTSEENLQYMLIMESDRLCIYKMSDERELVCDAPISPLLMSENDVLLLENGIVSDDFEEIVLYYESYAS